MSDAPKTDALREVVIRQYKEDELTAYGMTTILAALADIETLARERDNALSDAKQADVDSIRALAERNEARAQLAAERALADRLAGQLDDCLQSQDDIGWVMQALAAWKEARTPTEKKSDFS